MLKHKIETVLQDWKKYPSRQPAVQRYIKAYHRKIIPTLLTILSTVLGLLPFLFDGKAEEFWYSFAVGVMGSMLFSIIGLVFILPVFMPLGKGKRGMSLFYNL